MTIKERLIYDLKNTDNKMILTLVEKDNKTQFIINRQIIIKMIDENFSDTLEGNFFGAIKDTKVIEWYFEEIELTELERKTHFGL